MLSRFFQYGISKHINIPDSCSSISIDSNFTISIVLKPEATSDYFSLPYLYLNQPATVVDKSSCQLFDYYIDAIDELSSLIVLKPKTSISSLNSPTHIFLNGYKIASGRNVKVASIHDIIFKGQQYDADTKVFKTKIAILADKPKNLNMYKYFIKYSINGQEPTIIYTEANEYDYYGNSIVKIAISNVEIDDTIFIKVSGEYTYKNVKDATFYNEYKSIKIE